MLKNIQSPSFVAEAIVVNLTRYAEQKQRAVDSLLISAQMIMLVSGHQDLIPASFIAELETELRRRGFIMFQYRQAMFGLVRSARLENWLQLSMKYWLETRSGDVQTEDPQLMSLLVTASENMAANSKNPFAADNKALAQHCRANPNRAIIVLAEDVAHAKIMQTHIGSIRRTCVISPILSHDDRQLALGELTNNTPALYFIVRSCLKALKMQLPKAQVVSRISMTEAERADLRTTFVGAEFFFEEEPADSRYHFYNRFKGFLTAQMLDEIVRELVLVAEASTITLPEHVGVACEALRKDERPVYLAIHMLEQAQVIIMHMITINNIGMSNEDRLFLLRVVSDIKGRIAEEELE